MPETASTIGTALDRIIGSKKVLLAAIAGIANAVAATTGQNPMEGFMLVANGLFGALITLQGLLDLRWGSKSDGTGGA
jgi:hypothetical protein